MQHLTKEAEATAALPENTGRPSRKPKRNFWTRRIDEPTYVSDIVGPLERFDLRDGYINRMALQPGTSRYQAYYARHPELEEEDALSRSRYVPDEEPRARPSQDALSDGRRRDLDRPVGGADPRAGVGAAPPVLLAHRQPPQ